MYDVGRSWISDVQDRSESNSDDLQLPEKQTAPKGRKNDLPGRISGDFRIQKTGRNCWWWVGKKEVS
jgi:hypothetical protein